jgi:hypothetical protein
MPHMQLAQIRLDSFRLLPLHIDTSFCHDLPGERMNLSGLEPGAVRFKLITAVMPQPGLCDLAAARVTRTQEQDSRLPFTHDVSFRLICSFFSMIASL